VGAGLINIVSNWSRRRKEKTTNEVEGKIYCLEQQKAKTETLVEEIKKKKKKWEKRQKEWIGRERKQSTRENWGGDKGETPTGKDTREEQKGEKTNKRTRSSETEKTKKRVRKHGCKRWGGGGGTTKNKVYKKKSQGPSGRSGQRGRKRKRKQLNLQKKKRSKFPLQDLSRKGGKKSRGRGC